MTTSSPISLAAYVLLAHLAVSSCICRTAGPAPVDAAHLFKRQASPVSPPVNRGSASPMISADPSIWAIIFAKAQPMVHNMTLEENASVRVGLGAMCLQDGPLGVRPVRRLSQFPAGVITAATMLSPVAESGPLGRSPLDGGNNEGFCLDEDLGVKAAFRTVRSAQSTFVQTCAKHYIAYEQETFHQPYGSAVDSKTTHELYLWGFAEAVRAGTASITASALAGPRGYDEINGTHACQSSYALTEVLKGELGFNGNVAALSALDMSVPGINSSNGNFFGPALVDSVRNGTLPEERLGDMVLRALSPWLTLQDLDTFPYPTFDVRDMTLPTNNVQRDHWKLINKIGEESVTLSIHQLHNLLKLLISGSRAGANPRGWTSCGQDTLTSIGGSGWAYPPYRYVREGVVDVNVTLNDWDISNAQAQAALSASSLVFNLTLLNDGDKECNDAIVIIHAPEVVLLEECIERPKVTAVCMTYYPGKVSGESLPPLLWGEKSPSGKPPFVMGKALSDWSPNGIFSDMVLQPSVNFSEGKLIDWKWFQVQNITPRFGFGHGLSYATFACGQLAFEFKYAADNTSVHRTSERFVRGTQYDSCHAEQQGQLRAAEVVQLYVSFPADDAQGQPPKLLRGFEWAWLEPRQTTVVACDIRRKDVSVFDVPSNMWHLPKSAFTTSVGSSSESIHSTLQHTFVS
ncbi:glycoside hydrolase family 3 protein [Tilletiaria anomala UBC 951]|uniref:Probable beta-glucosidase G n=1 Tax=Tilletiaria anomala (strain ATCC 24038 / CBS 436.72 / UBC 951) TaxID=1037660 RepID=A0A066VKI6_TILAU|nr:glycoside hydrolase family 3 protein [Tilletiaria anomala UBC 951]KDN41986.1 glycoside hydrolase family 3 protein [Tilletiaria anomala UBC 951]